MAHRMFFSELQQAIDHAKKHGGWIFKDRYGLYIQWFDMMQGWKLTDVINATTMFGGGMIGPWTEFTQSEAA